MIDYGTTGLGTDLNAALANAAVTFEMDAERARAEAARLVAERDAALAALRGDVTPADDQFPEATKLYRQRANDHRERLASDYARRIEEARTEAAVATRRRDEARRGRVYVSRDDYRGSDWMQRNFTLYRAALDAGRVVYEPGIA